MLCLLGLAYAGRRLIASESYYPEDPRRTARVWRALRRATLVALALVFVGLLVSSRGLFGEISHQVDPFTQAKAVPVSDPARLLSTNSGNRWVWWKEAAGAFSARPLGGWGAGSFPTTHLLYRKPPTLSVRQPHNVPLQLLAETGLIGAAARPRRNRRPDHGRRAPRTPRRARPRAGPGRSMPRRRDRLARPRRVRLGLGYPRRHAPRARPARRRGRRRQARCPSRPPDPPAARSATLPRASPSPA